MANNPNKTVSVCATGMIVFFTDSNKHHFVKFEKRFKPVVKKQTKEADVYVFNKKQEKMYLEALYGLSIYSEEVVNKLPKNVVVKIMSRCEVVQKILNRWKQEIVNQRVDGLLLSLFPKSPVVKAMVDTTGYDDTLRTNIPFRNLGLNQYEIAKKLVQEKLLPQNFFNLV
jgi:hypothetical protein